ncbi:hypothetical protein CQ12_39525, partial [Bradyrhizobium jicamae]
PGYLSSITSMLMRTGYVAPPNESSELVVMALAELWQFVPISANEIADRWVIWDSNGRPRPREGAFGKNVVGLRSSSIDPSRSVLAEEEY